MASPGEDHSKSAAACRKKKHGLLGTIFMFPDGYDVALMIFGFLGSIGDGMTVPVLLLLYSRLMNTIGAANTSLPSSFALHMKQNALLLCYLACGQWVSCFLEGYCWTRTSERQASRLRIHYLKAVLRQDVGYFDLHASSTAEVIASVSSDTLIIQDVIAEKIPVFLMHLSTFIGGYAIGFLILWKLAIVGLPFVVLLVIPGLIYGRTLVNIGRQLRDEYTKADIVVEQAVSSIRTVYSFSSEDKTISDYSKALQAIVKLGLRQGLAKGLAIGSNGVVFAIWAFISYYGSRLVMYHGAQGGTVFAVGAAMIVGGLAFGSSLSNIKYFSEASAAGERILEVITRVPKIDSDNTEGLTLETVSGEIEFKHVEFAYPSRPNTIIFQDFNMKVPAGKTVALIGGSGSGKSTVFALLQRFYDPIDGEILLDALPVDKMELKWLRSKIGLVSQEPALFGTTIKENILFGKENASSLEIIEAAKDANAHGFISQLPNGYDTQVGERGTQLSGGQKQRIAIARALVKEPKIMLLDEATSALDSESECIVQEALDRASVGRTTIIIAHRLSTIRQAEFIMVLQNGLIKETGSHDELMTDDDGLYASLVRLQQDNRNDKLANADDCGGVSSANSLNNEIHSISSRRLSVVSRTSSASSTAQSRHMEATVFHPKQAFPAPSFRRLLAMNLPEWRQATSGCISAALFGAVQPVYAFALGAMIFAYFLPDHGDIKQETRKYALWFLALAMFSFLVNLSQHYSFAAMGEYLTKRIRERMLRKILTFEVGWFDQEDNSTGAVCSRLANDAKVVRSLVGDRMALLIQTFSAVAIACTMGLVIAWKLALVMISLQPLIIMCFYFKKSMFQSMSKKSIKAQEESSKLAAEAVSNLTTITSFSCQARILQMLEKAQESPTRENIRQSWFAGVVLATSQSLATCTWALDFWYGGKLMVEGYIGAKAVLQTFLILISTGKVIAEAGNMTSDLVKGANAVGSVFAILDKHSFIEPDDIDGHRPEKLTGKIEFSRVHFAYPTRPSVIIFQGFSINIEAGKSTALVGRSGSGKSTIIGLIQRFYDPIKGEVRIDGLDIKSYHLQSLRKRIALVSQEPTLFNGTIRDNILYGAPDNTNEAQMMEAANAANAHNFIAGLQDGYDTLCGDRGTQLSGGQKQRIAIARAILKNPEILLLDEATSALDSRSEKVLQDALDKLIGGRTTTLVVSHRLCSIQNCDLIAVLDKKKVVETGTHSSLMAKGQSGVYRRLVSLQASQLSIT